MPTPDEFPRMSILDFDVQISPQFSAEREIEPHFNREASNTWTSFFWRRCEAAEDIEFLGANFARAVEGTVEYVEGRLKELCEEANDDMVAYLASKPDQKASDIVELERLQAEAQAAGRWRLPPRPTPYTY